MAKFENIIANIVPNIANMHGGGSMYLVQTAAQTYYQISNNAASDCSYRKSTNGGLTWGPGVSIQAGTEQGIAVWYDGWTPGLATGLIHIAYTEGTTHDTFYRTINTLSSDALSTQTVVFAGASAVASGAHLSITRARGGNVYVKTQIDAGAEGGFYRLPNANVPSGAWDAVRTVNEALATTDQIILQPGFAADNQDIIALFWDASANEISKQIYDDSANTWSEVSIALTMTDIVRNTSGPHYAACCNTEDSVIYLAAWSNVDVLNSVLRFWTIDEGTTTEGTNVVLNSTDDQGGCAVSYDPTTGRIYVFYCGKSDGSETWFTAVNIYYKFSDDGGTTWSAETQLTTQTWSIPHMFCVPRVVTGTFPMVAFLEYEVTLDPSLRGIVEVPDQMIMTRRNSLIGR